MSSSSLSLSSTAKADDKSYKICSVLGGLDVTRYVSSNTRHFFQGAIEDVELIREYVSQAAANHEDFASDYGKANFDRMDHTLQWKARGFSKPTTTSEAGLGIADDRPDRVIDRMVYYNNKPFVGDKQTDMALIESVANLFPWIVDRKSVEELWWVPHQNGRSEGPEKEPFLFDSLYSAAWIGTYGEAWAYYPPFSKLSEDGHPFVISDMTGAHIDSHEFPFVEPNFPQNNPARRAFFRNPYPDVAQPGLSLITAMAPVYFTGTFGNYTYNNTYVASTGLDIAVSSVSSLLDVLLDKLTERLSFAILVDTNFHTVVISQTVVERIYPKRTGWEKERITYSKANASMVIEDRRNQTYQVSDTIHQGLNQLSNADWTWLQKQVQQLHPGERDFSKLNITLTGMNVATEYYVMYERWDYVADWVLMAFAPTYDVDHAMDVRIYSSNSKGIDKDIVDDIVNDHEESSRIHNYLRSGTAGNNTSQVVRPKHGSSVVLSGEKGHMLLGEAELFNNGTLDVIVRGKATPPWLQFYPAMGDKVPLPAGQGLPLQFNVNTSALDFGTSSILLTFTIGDDEYPDCFYNQDISLALSVKVTPKDCVALTNDPLRVPDLHGNCVCNANSVKSLFGDQCISYLVILPAILIPCLLIGLVIVHLYVEHKRKQADSVWSIKTSDLHFDDPPEIIGRGTFGLVVLAEYRGTQVAVKRVIPPRMKKEEKELASSSSKGGIAGSTGTKSTDSTFPFSNGSHDKPKKRASAQYFDFKADEIMPKNTGGADTRRRRSFQCYHLRERNKNMTLAQAAAAAADTTEISTSSPQDNLGSDSKRRTSFQGKNLKGNDDNMSLAQAAAVAAAAIESSLLEAGDEDDNIAGATSATISSDVNRKAGNNLCRGGRRRSYNDNTHQSLLNGDIAANTVRGATAGFSDSVTVVTGNTRSRMMRRRSYHDDTHHSLLNAGASIHNMRGITSGGDFRTLRSTVRSGKANDTLGRESGQLSQRGSASTSTDSYSKLKADFINEMRLLSKLRHPCITTVMGAVISNWEEPLLVMEYMDHGSLFDLLHNDTVAIEGDLVLPVLRDISSGLRFLHAANPQVIHGDLKAQNVLVDSRFRAKVTDFGLSQKRQVGAAGTPYWMAPELLGNKNPTNTAASDVYSFGIILYEVYSRKVPYDGEDFDEVIQQICDPSINKRPPIPSSMPEEVASLMTDCIHQDPLKRPTFREIDSRLKEFTVGNVEPGQVVFSLQRSKREADERNATDLLLEIFPEHVAEALRSGRRVEPEHFDMVTIFFSDIVGFTTISSKLSPRKVSDMLDSLYLKFDSLSRRHDVFKIETIGDAWLGVTNLASTQTDHVKRIALFAMDAIQAAGETLIDEDNPSKGCVQIRVGFHSGPVIANVVGSRHPKYSIFGDTVNTSARMESNSSPGCILCSDVSAKLLKEQAPEINLVTRGKIDVKGKGAMETFWVEQTERPITDFSPNSSFSSIVTETVSEMTPLVPPP